MKKASLAAAFAASLSLGSMPVCQAAEGAPVEDARAAEERVLGGADDDARFLAYQPFTREIAASVVVKTSLDQALAGSGVPADEARVAEEQLLGAADEEARFLAYQPFHPRDRIKRRRLDVTRTGAGRFWRAGCHLAGGAARFFGNCEPGA